MEYLHDSEVMQQLDVCVIPSLDAVFVQLQELLLANVLFCITTNLSELPAVAYHLASLAFGSFALNSLIPTYCVWWYCGFVAVGYAALSLLDKFRSDRPVFGLATLAFLVISGELLIDGSDWMACRGVFMVGTMKLLSLAQDSETFDIPSYLGYMYCPTNVIFGPWMSFEEYFGRNSFGGTSSKLAWVKCISCTAAKSLFFLTISNCWATYFVPDDSHIWLVTFREALSFRTSHYFVSYLSESLTTLGGFKSGKSDRWGYPITRPFDIELPTSLVQVVVAWNVPMHRFLKKYVYRSAAKFGQSQAIVITYIVSSLLHGYSLEISAVLLSIGLFSIVQLRFLSKLAGRLDACVGVRPCKSNAQCCHGMKRSHPVSRLVLGVSGIVTVVNLAYLGSVMDRVDRLQKWRDLNFVCHGYMAVIYLVSYLL